MQWIDGDWIYDIETYPNVFTFSIVRGDGKHSRVYEVSDHQNDTEGLFNCLRHLRQTKQRMVGFNNLAFDYPVIHYIMMKGVAAKMTGESYQIDARDIYSVAMKQIASARDGFANTVPVDEELIKQVDLFKIHHFDNKARATSLKMLEFNMKSNNIEDLPFPVGKHLSKEEIVTLKTYNQHDVKMTLDFYRHSIDALKFRASLSEKYGKDFTNHNDTKIGKDYFIMRLESAMPGSCYKMQGKKRVLNQTIRKIINIKECLFDCYDFKQSAFHAVLNWFSEQRITETKGVFSDIEEHELGDVAGYADLTVKREFKLVHVFSKYLYL